MDEHMKQIEDALCEPFGLDEIKFRPGSVSGNRCLALPYVDARLVQDRLDEVLGVVGWQDEYECLPDGCVVCRLKIKLGSEWIVKMDVGSPSEQPDEGDRRKAAFSDALKRVAVKFGIGRYLYRCGQLWADYDPQKKRIVKAPALPPSAVPKRQQARQASKPATAASKLPANGAELRRRLLDYGDKLAQEGLCAPGELTKFVVQQGIRAGHDADLAIWSGPAIAAAAEWTREFEAAQRAKKATPPAAKPPVQAPAPAQPAAREPGDPDPAELIGPPEERRLQSLMKDAGKVWGKLIEWLNRKANAGLPATTKIRDISFAHYWLMEKRLLQSIEEAKQPQKQGAA